LTIDLDINDCYDHGNVLNPVSAVYRRALDLAFSISSFSLSPFTS
jgi:hypothetical protein